MLNLDKAFFFVFTEVMLKMSFEVLFRIDRLLCKEYIRNLSSKDKCMLRNSKGAET